MAEVAGLTLGTVALVTLYSGCVDLINCIESGKNYVVDYERVCTKLCLLRRRLLDWGQTSNIAAPLAPGHEFLQNHWFEDQQRIVHRSLTDIQSIFRTTSLLVEKYKTKEKAESRFGRTLTSRSLKNPPSTHSTPGSKSRGPSLNLLRRRATWAIHDKQQLDSSIQELDFLITNLEAVTYQPRMSNSSRHQTGQRSVDSGYGSVVESPKSEDLGSHPDTQLAQYRADQRARDPSAQFTQTPERPSASTSNDQVNAQASHRPAEKQAQSTFSINGLTITGSNSNNQLGNYNTFTSNAYSNPNNHNEDEANKISKSPQSQT